MEEFESLFKIIVGIIYFIFLIGLVIIAAAVVISFPMQSIAFILLLMFLAR